MKKDYQYITIAVLVLILLGVIITGQMKEKEMRERNAEMTAVYQTKVNERNEQAAIIEQLIPGIVVWGDSLTAGVGGDGVTYPSVLQDLIETTIYDIPVVNMGVAEETTNTIMGRAGSVPYVVDAFTIPEDRTKVEVKITSFNGNPVTPLLQGDLGVNPVTINGIEGILSIRHDSPATEQVTYTFHRLENGEVVKVEEDTFINTAALSVFENYIPIVFMGQKGQYDSNKDLVNQINSTVTMNQYQDKFLVLGLTSGTEEVRMDLEKLMENEFGDRYVNLREILSTEGLEIARIEPTAADLKAMKTGAVPPSLLADKVHFNAQGYEVIGQIVFERMQELGYFDKVLYLIEEM